MTTVVSEAVVRTDGGVKFDVCWSDDHLVYINITAGHDGIVAALTGAEAAELVRAIVNAASSEWDTEAGETDEPQ